MMFASRISSCTRGSTAAADPTFRSEPDHTLGVFEICFGERAASVGVVIGFLFDGRIHLNIQKPCPLLTKHIDSSSYYLQHGKPLFRRPSSMLSRYPDNCRVLNREKQQLSPRLLGVFQEMEDRRNSCRKFL